MVRLYHLNFTFTIEKVNYLCEKSKEHSHFCIFFTFFINFSETEAVVIKNTLHFIQYILTGLCNGIFGSGGGIIAVSCLKSMELSQKESQATAMSITLVLSIISTFYYFFMGFFSFKEAFLYIPFGIPGALLGSFLLNKAPDNLLKKLFALFTAFAGIRMILK